MMIYDDFLSQLGNCYVTDNCFSISKSLCWEDTQSRDFGIENVAGIPRIWEFWDGNP